MAQRLAQKARWRAAALHRKKCYFVLLRVFLYPLNKAIFRHNHALSDVKRREILTPKEIVCICAGNAQDCGDIVCAQAERQLVVMSIYKLIHNICSSR